MNLQEVQIGLDMLEEKIIIQFDNVQIYVYN